MTPFLQHVAADLFRKTQGDLSRTLIVFPSKRAGLYVNEYLLDLAGESPLWAPRYTTISELFADFAPDLAVADRIDATLIIVELFQQLTQQPVSVDWFYGWAERILDDFEDVDKNMVNADALFQNVADIKEIEQMDYLTESQQQVLERFFKEFDPSRRGQLREKYEQLWRVMKSLYVQLNERLAQQGQAYEGALYRRVVERLQHDEIQLDAQVDHYAFVGFNLLDRVEREFFAKVRREGRAWFYWDYDRYYQHQPGDPDALRGYEAGLFLSENLKAFPNELPPACFDNLLQPKEIVMAAASTEAIQAQYVAPWLGQHLTADKRRTAVVLCNEALLQPVLHALPKDIHEVNITKGFPLAHTEAVTFVERELARWEREKTTLGIAQLLERLLEKVRQRAHDFVCREDFSEQRFEDVLQSEAYYQMLGLLERFAQVLMKHVARLQGDFTLVTLRRLIRQMVRTATIPFSGEPVVGLQVMGVLETRCLDFDSVILLSANDGVLPKKADYTSFVPYLLRRAFGMTVPERKTAVFAYYFYRLIQRASHVTMTYNTSATTAGAGEMSRFMTQLLVEWPYRVEHLTLNSSQAPTMRRPAAQPKPADLAQRLVHESRGIISFSPSALNTYLNCQLRFWYRYVEGIEEPKPDPDEIQPNVLGSIFHKAAEIIYQPEHKGTARTIATDELRLLLQEPERLRGIIRRAFEEEETTFRLLQSRVVEMFLRGLLTYDSKKTPFRIIGTEKAVESVFDIDDGQGGTLPVRIGGIIDRLDDMGCEGHAAGSTLRIVDYKTGGKEESAASLDDLFRQGSNKHYMLQTFIYSLILLRDYRVARPIVPALFFVNHAARKDYSPLLLMGKGKDKQTVTDFSVYREEFEQRLLALLAEILDTSIPFSVPESDSACRSCPYYSLCYR